MAQRLFLLNSKVNQQDFAESWANEYFTGKKQTSHLVVSEQGTPDKTVNIASGLCLIPYTRTSTTPNETGKALFFLSVAESTAQFSDNSSGSDRVDTLIVKLDPSKINLDSLQARLNAGEVNGTGIASIQVVENTTGTPTSTMADADIDTALGHSNWIRLANVTCTNGFTQITNANISNALSELSFSINGDITAGTVTVKLDANSQTIENVADPVNNTDATPKLWVESLVTGSVPIPLGTLFSFLKDYTGASSLASIRANGWAVCDGTTPASQGISGAVITTTPNLTVDYYLKGGASSGTTGGSNTHTLTTAEMPSHNHTISRYNAGSSTVTDVWYSGTTNLPLTPATRTTNSVGGGSAHNNEPKYYTVVYIMKVNKNNQMILCPLKGKEGKDYTITQYFGGNYNVYKQFGLDGHDGLDFGAKEFTPVYAPFDGVAYQGIEKGGYGNFIRLQSDTRECVLAHLHKFAESNGKEVKAGDLIGYVGNTGFSTGSHLHFGFRLRKKTKDWLGRPRYEILNYNNGYKGYIDVIQWIVQWEKTLGEL